MYRCLCIVVPPQPVKIDPDRYQLPPEGIITFDYITYTRGTVLEGTIPTLPAAESIKLIS
jgi:hypothetical protein